jgi:hypothetical protein
MGRLIDVDVLKKHYAWWNNEEKEIFDAIVDAQPTAFDLDKVVQELEEELNEAKCLWDDDEFYTGKAWAYQYAIDRVKAGGIDAE